MAHRGRTGAVVGQQPFGGARASGTNHKATEAGLNRPELDRRDLRSVFPQVRGVAGQRWGQGPGVRAERPARVTTKFVAAFRGCTVR
jgi:hypothetical protein